MSAPEFCQWANQLCEQPNHHGCTRCPLATLPTTLVGLYAALRNTPDPAERDRLLDAILDHPDHDPRPGARAR